MTTEPAREQWKISKECVFCDIINGKAPAEIRKNWDHAIALVPLNPVVEGHLLIIPKLHVANAAEDPDVTGDAMACAAEYARIYDSFNIITSAGSAATQTVGHLHLHLIPRAEGDGLSLPWTDQPATRALAEVATALGMKLGKAEGRKQAGEEIAQALERCEDDMRRAEVGAGISGNLSGAKTWFDLATGYMRSAELARDIASQPQEATQEPPSAPEGYMDLPGAERPGRIRIPRGEG